jgi:hypothetical protein
MQVETLQCANCAAPMDSAFCPQCGQKRVHDADLSVKHAVQFAAEELLDVDGRIVQTVRLLFTQPWRLTLDFLEGRRARYVNPLRLFLVFGAVFFLAQASTMTTVFESRLGTRVAAAMRAEAQEEGVPYEAVVARHDQILAMVYKAGYIVGSLLSGLWLWLFFRRDYPYLAQHMVTALYLSCIGMTLLLLAELTHLMVIGGTRNPTAVGGGPMGTAAFVVLTLYFGRTLEHVYMRGSKSMSARLRFMAVNLLVLLSTVIVPTFAVSRYLQTLLR